MDEYAECKQSQLMLSRRAAEVTAVKFLSSGCEELAVSVDGRLAKAVNYPSLTGPTAAGDRVVLNTTAVDLGLGSGGFHFVCLNLGRPEQKISGSGHIMKLRYTPLQLRVLAVEEEASPHHRVMAEADTLAGMPVIVAELHSMLPPVALTMKKEKPGLRLAYVMTDGGALPSFFSNTVRILKERQMICGTVTAGQAFGGDLEAVNIYSGLLAARYVLQADAAVICMGPGMAGTGTPFGFSGIEAGENINRVGVLHGHAVALPRVSFSDSRERHRGISHHTLTALGRAALVSADLPVPVLGEAEDKLITRQIEAAGLDRKHRIFRYENLSLNHLEPERKLCSTMGRSLDEDKAFFLAAVAAAKHAAALPATLVQAGMDKFP